MIGRMNFQVKRFDSSSAAKLNIKFHQSPAGTQSSVIRVHTNIEELGFLCHIPKTYKTDHPLFGSVFYLHDKTIANGILYFLDEHIPRPKRERVGTLHGNDLIQILDVHLLNGHLFPLHLFKTHREASEASRINGIPSDSIIPSRLSLFPHLLIDQE